MDQNYIKQKCFVSTNVSAMERRKQAANKIDNIMRMSSILRPRKR